MQFKKIKTFLITVFILFFTAPCYAFSIKDMTLKFVQVTDSHISQRQDTSYKTLSSSRALLEDAIGTINNDIAGVDFVMFTGDMVDEPFVESYRDFFKILSGLNYPSLSIFGNHDSIQCSDETKNCTEGLSKAEVLEIIKKCNPNYVFDKTYYAFSPKPDYRIIALDTTINDQITANGYLPEEQLKFLDDELNNNREKIVVIFVHHPIVEPFLSADHNIKNAHEILNIIRKYKNPIIVCSGHYHTTKIKREKNIIYVSTPSLVTYPNAFRTIKMTSFEDRVTIEIKFEETTLKNVQEKSRQNTIAATSFYGTEKDRDFQITYKKPASKAALKNNRVKKAKPQKQKAKNYEAQDEWEVMENGAQVTDKQAAKEEKKKRVKAQKIQKDEEIKKDKTPDDKTKNKKVKKQKQKKEKVQKDEEEYKF